MKNGPRDEETQKLTYFAYFATLQVEDSLSLTADVSLVCCAVFVVFAGIW